MRSLLYFCVPCGCLALASESVVAGGEAAPIGEVQALGQTFAVWNPEQFNAIMRELQPTIGPSDDARTLYVHLAGSIEGMFPRIPGKQNWLAIRILPGPVNTGAGVLGELWYQGVFERPALREHLNHFTINDLVTGAEERVEKERLYVRLGLRSDSREIPLKRWAKARGQILVPKDEQNGQYEWGEALVLSGVDRGAQFNYMNVSVHIRTNFSNVASSVEFAKAPAEATPPLLAALHIRQYLQGPFPRLDDVRRKDARLITSFTADSDRATVGEDVEIRLAFALDALRSIEWVRVRADAGQLRRDGERLIYRGTMKGPDTLTVEAVSGTQWNGKVECADRRGLKIHIE